MLTKKRFSGDTLRNHRPKRYNKKTEPAKHTQTKNAIQQEIQSHPPRERRRKEENGESEDQPIISSTRDSQSDLQQSSCELRNPRRRGLSQVLTIYLPAEKEVYCAG
jgi:hypothetical protein